MKSEVRELLTEELKDAYSAEKQALRCMQRALRKASAEELREGIQMHIEQTQVQIERVEQAMEKLSVRPGRKVCEAMRGLVEEAQHDIEEQDEKGPILDLVIVAGMQRIEHYEIAAYGTGIALAEAVGEQKVADLLSETLEEEKQTDLKLTEVTQKAIIPEAIAGEERRPWGAPWRWPFRRASQGCLNHILVQRPGEQSAPGPSTPERPVIGLGLAMAAQGQDGTPAPPEP